MLRIEIPISPEGWDDEKQEFVEPKTQTLQLEHSLVSLSKWEAKWNKPFLSKDIMSHEETVDYIRCMTITQNVDPDVYNHLSAKNIQDVNDYMNAKMTATWFSEDKPGKGGKNNGKQTTNELIYYWMISLNIPKECEKWHLNRLLTLIRVCNTENQPAKNMSKREAMRQQKALNDARRKQLNTRG